MEYKLVVLGGGGVGKSSLTIRFVTNDFPEEYDPTIQDSFRKQVCIDDQSCLLDIVDTTQQEVYCSLGDWHLREGQGFVCVYDITSRASFEEVTTLYDLIRRAKKNSDDLAVVVVGNKCDLESQRQVAVAEGAALARSLGGGCVFLETSAKEDVNVQECFFAAVRQIRRFNNGNEGNSKATTEKEKEKNKNGGNSQRCSLS